MLVEQSWYCVGKEKGFEGVRGGGMGFLGGKGSGAVGGRWGHGGQ